MMQQQMQEGQGDGNKQQPGSINEVKRMKN